MSNDLNFFDRVYNAVKRIPKGKVATYGMIAAMSGNPRAARVVGTALHRNPAPGVIPCHRVVNPFGGLAPEFAFGGKEVQRQLLENEGVAVSDDFTVALSVYLWNCDND